MNISLPPELERFIASKVASGLYEDASAVIQEGLRLLEAQDADHDAALAEVRSKITEGLESARRGDLFDGEAFFDELERDEQRLDDQERRIA